MVALVVLAIGLAGSIGTFEWSERGLQRGSLTTQALALIESRLEAKRVLPWEQLLMDDVDRNGSLETRMHDDGLLGDAVAGDGIFTSSVRQGPIRLTWTVETNRVGPLSAASLATIEVRAAFQAAGDREREVRVRTIRANPRYVGHAVVS